MFGTYMTGCSTFKEAYDKETETQLITSEGLLEEAIVREDERINRDTELDFLLLVNLCVFSRQ
jgi:hypothetical protein